MEKDELLAAIMEIIVEVGIPDAVEKIEPDTDLVSCGVLDSFGKVELVDMIWEQFRLEISPAELFAEKVTALSIADAINNNMR